MSRRANEISSLLQAAGLLEQARAHLEHIGDHQRHREVIKRLADEIAATAVAEKVKIANEFEQNWGRD